MIDVRDRIKGGIFGMLVGDALGVPYEFNRPEALPSKDQIEFQPPPGFDRSHAGVAPGTWSDDGAQALCLLDSLLTCGRLDIYHLASRLLDWYEKGLWAVDGDVFDVGIQTSRALMAFKGGVSPRESGLVNPEGKGNGSLMRVLPLALWHRGSDTELVNDAHLQSLVTHGHPCNQVCCALYCLWARRLLDGTDSDTAYQAALTSLRAVYAAGKQGFLQELEWSVRPDDVPLGKGGGYVVDCLRSARMLINGAQGQSCASYEEVVKSAVALGDDTDTTAAVAGGLAGIIYGFSGIPQRWYDALKEKEEVLNCIERWKDMY